MSNAETYRMFKCPHCGTVAKSKVLATDRMSDDRGLYRRRQCKSCLASYSTVEAVKEPRGAK